MVPTLGRTVLFRSRTGNYTLAAEVIGTQASLNPRGVELGHVPELDSPWHVHLLVRTPGAAVVEHDEAVIDQWDAPFERPQNGLYREWNVPPSALWSDGAVYSAAARWDYSKFRAAAVAPYGEGYEDDHRVPVPFAPRSWAWRVNP